VPTEPSGKFRYRGLRLMIQAAVAGCFSCRERWTAQGRTLIVPYDDAVRLRLIPRPRSVSRRLFRRPLRNA
jgi:hypothetical protein